MNVAITDGVTKIVKPEIEELIALVRKRGAVDERLDRGRIGRVWRPDRGTSTARQAPSLDGKGEGRFSFVGKVEIPPDRGWKP